MFSKILVCLDSSTASEEILPYAAEVARRFNSTLVLFSAIDVPTTSAPEFPVELDLIQDLRKKEAQQYLDAIADGLRQSGIAAETAVTVGSPGDAIVDYATTHGIELIAIETHGRKNIGRLVFGSVTDYVLRHISVPVLALKPGAKSA